MQNGEYSMSTTSITLGTSTSYGRLCQLYPEISYHSTGISSTIPVACPMRKASSSRMEVAQLVNHGARSSSAIPWMSRLLTFLRELVSIKDRPASYWFRQQEEDAERLGLSLCPIGNESRSS